MIKVYGIRHHGPGSSKALLEALDSQQPDLVLIEGPPDADDLIRYAAHEKMRPPVALLVYNPKNFSQGTYYPFADFSPEWQAMKYAVERKIPVRFIDLPKELEFAFFPDGEEGPEQPEKKIWFKKQRPKYENDPLAYIAELAGYDDSERWWEVAFEQTEHGAEVFDQILDMMAALRDSIQRTETKETLLREAWMRNVIRAAEREMFTNIGVVCGGWHAPVLQRLADFKASSDLAFFKGIKKIPTVSTWVPWSYDRLSSGGGYGAGVVSPAWYEMLFQKRKDALPGWMTRAARLLRLSDLAASSAQSIDAVRLAETLAVLRGRDIAGMDEMFEAAQSVLCNGEAAPMRFVKERLIVGDSVGKVPPEIPQVPLQRDMEATIKTSRLSKEYASSEASEKELDLRKESALAASKLLHRLALMNIPWGKPMKGSQYKLGSFSEKWKLHWRPDYAIRVIEAGGWGATVYDAAVRYTRKKATDAKELAALAALLKQALDAGLDDTVSLIVRRLQEVSAATSDVLSLMEALPELIGVLRYGDVRRTDSAAVESAILQIIPRICIGAPSACLEIDDDAAAEVSKALTNINQTLQLFNRPDATRQWTETLVRIAGLQGAHGTPVGKCCRIALDRRLFTTADTGVRMRYALSTGNDPNRSAQWLEGFLEGSGLLLIHHPQLWNILNEWIGEINMERFMAMAPLLRRTFSNFSAPERKKMLQLAREGARETAGLEIQDFDKDRAGVVLPLIRLLIRIMG